MSRLARYWRPIVGWGGLVSLGALAAADLPSLPPNTLLAWMIPWICFCVAFTLNERTFLECKASNPTTYRLLVANAVAVGIGVAMAALAGFRYEDFDYGSRLVRDGNPTLFDRTSAGGWGFLYLGVPILAGTWASSVLNEPAGGDRPS